MNDYVTLGESIGALFVICRTCGCVVVNREDHDRWHASVHGTTAEAQS